MPMADRLLELQNLAAGSSARVSELLRRTMVLASELGVEDLRVWAKAELNGYEAASAPEYRLVSGSPAFMSAQGKLPFLIRGASKELSQIRLYQPIAEVEHYAYSDKEFIALTFPEAMREVIAKHFDLGTYGMPVREVARSQFLAVVDRVRTMVTDWTIELRKSGIHDSQTGFTTADREVALAATYTITNFYGVLGSFSGGSVSIDAGTDIEGQIQQLATITQSAKQEILEVITALKTSEGPTRESVVTRGMNWLRKYGPLIGTVAKTVHDILIAKRDAGGS